MGNGNGSSDGGAAGGSGLGSGLSLADQVKSTVQAIEAVVSAGEAVVGWTQRSVVCEIDNVCGHTLNYDTDSFSHGGFAGTLPPPTIPDKSNGLWGAASTGFLVGVEGYVTYGIDDGAGSKFIVHFDNPEVGGNSSDCSVINTAISNVYWTRSITGSGNNGAQMRFILGHFNPPFSLRTYLHNSNAPIGGLRSLGVTSVKAFIKV